MDTIEKLIEKIQKGECSKDELYEKIKGFIEIQRKKYLPYANRGAMDEGDILSLVWLGIENAISGYSPQKNCKFYTWASACIKFCILDEVKKSRRACLSLDECIDDDGELSREETVADPESLDVFSNAENAIDGRCAMTALKTLSKKEQEVITLCCIDGLPLSKAAEKMKISVSRATALKAAALRRLRIRLT